MDPAQLVYVLHERGTWLDDRVRVLLSRHKSGVVEAWRRAMASDEDLVRVVSWHHAARGLSGAAASLRTSHSGWITQPLVWNGTSLEAGAMIAATAKLGARRRPGPDRAHQLWYPRREPALDSLEALARDASGVTSLFHLLMPKRECRRSVRGVRVEALDDSTREELYHLAARARGQVSAEADELGHPDVLLEDLDAKFARVGLRRYRRIHLARFPFRSLPVAAIVVHRGPLGFAASMENRCDLLVDPSLTDPQLVTACVALLQSAASAYADFELPHFPIVTDERGADALSALGASLAGGCAQAAWLRADYERLSERFAGLELRFSGVRGP